MRAFVDIAGVDEIACGSARSVTIDGSLVAVFNAGGRLFAVDDACLRCGSSLSHGTLDGHAVACSRCGWRYDLATGTVVGVPALRLETFPVRIVDARVEIGGACASPSSRP